MTKSQYSEKLKSCFISENFEELKSDPTKNDLRKFRKLLNKFLTNIDENYHKKFEPNQRIKQGYGLIKLHKDGFPIRPIISSFQTITSNSEAMFLQFLKPLEKSIKFSVDSSKTFKLQIQPILEKSDLTEYTFVSFDARDLYTKCNLEKIKKIICSKMFDKKGKQSLFPESENSKMSKSSFIEFFDAILTEFNNFQCPLGYFKQIKGLSMGSKLSGFLSNIFLNDLETKILPKYLKKRTILHYGRYVDDCLLLVKKNEFHKIFDEFNNYDDKLNFTFEEMSENKINFLDMTIELKFNKCLIWNYVKPQNLLKTTDFKFDVSPKQQKVGTLVGEIYRINNTSNTPETLAHGLEKLKQKYLKNNFPEKLVSEKIHEVQNRNFEKSEYRREINEKIKNTSFDDSHSLTLPFTSFRCQNVATEIRKIISRFCPEFSVNICFSTIKLKNILNPKLKSKIDLKNTCCSVYQFKCKCNEIYVGETKKLLEFRVFEHRRDVQSHVKMHIDNCAIYQNNLLSSLGPEPSLAQKRCFLLNHFSILEKNLTNSYIRKTAEANFINLLEPSLNKQVFHHKMTLICSCLSKNPDKAIPEGIT